MIRWLLDRDYWAACDLYVPDQRIACKSFSHGPAPWRWTHELETCNSIHFVSPAMKARMKCDTLELLKTLLKSLDHFTICCRENTSSLNANVALKVRWDRTWNLRSGLAYSCIRVRDVLRTPNLMPPVEFPALCLFRRLARSFAVSILASEVAGKIMNSLWALSWCRKR